jgi:copper oxidase (laccase) domain-containing protein
MRSYYVTQYSLQEGVKTAYRWNGTSTVILRYFVPATTAASSNTDRWSILIDPEAKFEQFEVFLSQNSKFNLADEK